MTRFLSSLTFLITVLSFPAFASAKIEALPSALKAREAELEIRHKEGLERFFIALGEDCDAWDVLNQTYVPPRSLLPPAPPLFRIQSRVLAQCLREEIWFCLSSFTKDGTYRFTDCETDSPLFEE